MNNKAIYFYSRKELPYGVFSNFSSHPIWIDGRRYRTVEHWYQASKTSSLEDHDWIRNAETPEEAKRRGQEMQLPHTWEASKIVTMYRGVLCKFRQHPALGELLKGTGTLPIHEAGGDKFWGFPECGEDWLGRILVWVRSQLIFMGDFHAGQLFDLVSTTPLVRYQMSVAIRQLRSRGEAWLIHLVKYMDNRHPLDVLATILASRKLEASRQLNGFQSVCFSGTSLGLLEDKVFGREAGMRRMSKLYEYSPYGIAVKFDFAREYGFKPVTPVGSHSISMLPSSLQFAASAYSAADCFDYTHEDEWRYPLDLDLSAGPFAVVLPNVELKRLKFYGLWDQTVDHLELIKGFRK